MYLLMYMVTTFHSLLLMIEGGNAWILLLLQIPNIYLVSHGKGPLASKLIENLLSTKEREWLLAGHTEVKNELDAFITAMGQPTDSNCNAMNDFNWQFSMKEFRRTFQKTRESTACDLSGLNMSYWKASAEDDDIATVQAFFIEKAFQFGFAYPRWQTSWKGQQTIYTSITNHTTC